MTTQMTNRKTEARTDLLRSAALAFLAARTSRFGLFDMDLHE